MPRVSKKNKRESLLEEKRKILEKLNAIDLQIKEVNKEAKEKWDVAFQKGVGRIRTSVLGEDYYSQYGVDSVLSCVEGALKEMVQNQEEKTPEVESADEKADAPMEDAAEEDHTGEEKEPEPDVISESESSPASADVPSDRQYF